jgi:nitrogen fixation NifU-like protein
MTPSDRDSFDTYVIEHFEDPYHRGPLVGWTHACEAESPICDDVVRMELRITAGGQVEEAWFDGDGCLVSQASASMLAEHVEGMSAEQARSFSALDMLKLFGENCPPSRQKCCLLAWRAFQQALDSPADPEFDNSDKKFGGPSLREES